MATEAYKVTVGGIQFGAWMQNQFYYLYDNGAATDRWLVAKQLVTDWIAEVLPSWLLCMPSEYGVQWISAIRTSAGGGKVYIKEFPGGTEVGGLGTEASNVGTAPVVKLYAGMGVDTQGRIFLPAPAEGYLVDNVYQAGYTAAVSTMLGHLVTFTASGRTYNLAIHSPKLAQTVAVSAAALGPIIGNIGRRRVPR